MIRYTILVAAILVIAGIATKNWYRALCFMLPLLAVLERGDMPRQMLGIGGLNPFNILLGIILLAYLVQRRYDGSEWRASKQVTRLFIVYMIILLVSTFRAIADLDTLQFMSILAKRDEIPTMGSMIKDELFNTFKWLSLGILLSIGASSKERVKLAVTGILLTSLLLGMQVISKMLPGLIGADDLAARALRVLDRDLGYHRVDVAAIMSGAAWAFIAARPLFKSPAAKFAMLGGFGICSIALISTGGRAGMLSYVAAALVLGFLRWRKLLLLMPLAGVLALAVIPGLKDRLMMGFGADENDSEAQIERRAKMGAIDESGRDRYAITSGRVVVWPLVIDKAMEKPVFGHGRIAMQRTGIVSDLENNFGITSFGHPHNAYLQLFIDTGFVGLIFVGLFYFILFRRSVSAFKNPRDDTEYAVAALAVAFFVANLTASLGSQSFYPKQGGTMFWIVIGLVMARLTGDLWKSRSDRKQPEPAPQY